MIDPLSKLMQLFVNPEHKIFQGACWCPPADVYRNPQGWLIKFDLAGIKPEDIHISVQEHQLKIHGTRRDFSSQEGQQSYVMEIAYNRFERILELPMNLEDVTIRSEYHNGMFFVHLLEKGNDA